MRERSRLIIQILLRFDDCQQAAAAFPNLLSSFLKAVNKRQCIDDGEPEPISVSGQFVRTVTSRRCRSEAEIESVICRVVNLRVKSHSTYWLRENAETMFCLRAWLKAGRAEERFQQTNYVTSCLVA